MKTVAVITGDIIASRKVAERDKLTRILKEVFQSLDDKLLKTTDTFEIYRGDSFQGILQNPAQALLAAVLIRARLRRWEDPAPPAAAGKPLPVQLLPDARISIGIGTVTYMGKRIIESDGEAFRYSGELLDTMKNADSELAIRTPWQDVNEELAVLSRLLDAIIGKWSSASAEVVYAYLLEDHTQKELSGQLGISQPAVHKRLLVANIDAIQASIARFEKLITQHLE